MSWPRQRDPVCGMELDPAEVVDTVEYEGRIYSFDSPGCKEDFEKNPRRYTGR